MKSVIFTTVFCCLVPTCAVQGFAQGTRQSSTGTELLVDDFNGQRNRLDGYRNTFQSAPSFAIATRTPLARFGHAGLGLQLTADRKQVGYCGFWIHFFNIRATPYQFVDAANFECLCFWVKGASGGEQFTIKLADDVWIAKEDSLAVGDVGKFLRQGVTTRWQKVRIPLTDQLGLNLRRLGGLTLEFQTPGQCTVFIDEVTFESSQPGNPLNTAATASDSGKRRTLCLSNAESMLGDPLESNRFFEFCTTQGIKQLWVQLPYQVNVDRKSNHILQSDCVIQRHGALRRFLSDAHAAGLAVHAGAGLPEYAQRRCHHVPLAIVDAVLSFNLGQPATEQFDGIHFKIEPHRLVGWHDPQQRKQILYEFLTLNRECQRRARGAVPRIEFGAEIPQWFCGGSASPSIVSFQGVRQATGRHLIEMLDNVSVISDRDFARGTGGMIDNARDILSHADRCSAAKVFVGVETSACESTPILFAVGRSRTQFRQTVQGAGAEIANISRLDGYQLRVIDDGEQVHVGLEVATVGSVEERRKIARSITRLASLFGIPEDEQPEISTSRQISLAQRLTQSKEWSNVTTCNVRDPDTGRVHLLVKADSIVPCDTTFADETAQQFAAQTGLAEDYFVQHPSFAGLAVHDNRSPRDLMSGANAGVRSTPDRGSPLAKKTGT